MASKLKSVFKNPIRMLSEILEFFEVGFEDLDRMLSPYPKKKKPSADTPDDDPTLWPSSSYEPGDCLTKDQWQEIYDGKKSLKDYMIEPHVWPPQLTGDERAKEGQNEAGHKAEASEEEPEGSLENEESDEGISEEESSEGSPENAEAGEASDSIDSYENSVSEPDFGGAFESDSGGSSDAGDFDSGFDSGN